MEWTERLIRQIKAEMKRQGLKKADIERLGGPSQKYMSDLLRGKSKSPTHRKIVELATALGVSINKLSGNVPQQMGSQENDEVSEPLGSPRQLQHAIEAQLAATDPYMARIVEDLIELLVVNELISEKALPAEARRLLERRRALRTVA